MGRSLPKLLPRPADALRGMDDVLGRYPEAGADVRAVLGDEGLADMRRAREVLSQAPARLGAERPPACNAGDAGA